MARAARAAQFIDDLAAAGRLHFTTEDVARALGTSVPAVRASLRRLKAKREVADPHRGFHVIVPPEFRRLGCLPAEQFMPQLMALTAVGVSNVSANRMTGDPSTRRLASSWAADPATTSFSPTLRFASRNGDGCDRNRLTGTKHRVARAHRMRRGAEE